MRQGDVIISFDGRKVDSAADLPRFAAETPVGKKVIVEVIRDGKRRPLTVQIADIPDRKAAATVREAVASFGITVREARGGGNVRNDFAGKGVVVTAVFPTSAAAEAGFIPGDVVLEINRKKVSSLESFTSLLNALPAGEPVLVLVDREGKGLYLTVSPVV